MLQTIASPRGAQVRYSWLGLPALSLALSAAAADWPQFLGPARDGVSPETGLLHVWPVEGPKVLWTAPVQPGFGGPVVQGRKVYLLERTGDQQDVFCCLDFATGKEEWTCAFDAPGVIKSYPGSRCIPAVDDRYVFGIGPFGDFYAVDKATHQPAWRAHLLKDYGGELPMWHLAQSPLLYQDRVIVAPQSATAGVIACDKATGKVIWKSKPIGAMSHSSPYVTTVGGREQVVMVSLKGIAGVDVRDGALLWEYAWACHRAIPQPVPLGEGRFFVVGGYGAGCAGFQVQAQEGQFTVKELFKHKRCNAQIPTPILYQGHLYAVSNDNGPKQGLMCLALDGAVKWQTNSAPSFDRGNTLLADGMLYQMDGATGALYLIQPSPDGYKELAKAKVLEAKGKFAWGPMALSDGKLLVRDQHELKCLDVRGK